MSSASVLERLLVSLVVAYNCSLETSHTSWLRSQRMQVEGTPTGTTHLRRYDLPRANTHFFLYTRTGPSSVLSTTYCSIHSLSTRILAATPNPSRGELLLSYFEYQSKAATPVWIRENSSLSTNSLFYRLATSYRQREVRTHCNGPIWEAVPWLDKLLLVSFISALWSASVLCSRKMETDPLRRRGLISKGERESVLQAPYPLLANQKIWLDCFL